MSNTAEETDAGNGETTKPPYGLKQLARPLSREQIALGIYGQLLRHEPPGTRRKKAKDLANEAFELADVFRAEAAEERGE